jgi:CDP-diacylglycerol---serine O-phosphatidyltransferase
MDYDDQDLQPTAKPGRRSFLSFVPNALTLAAILCGFASLPLSQGGEFAWAMAAILAAALFDIADGYAARRLSAESAVGAQLDSLADFLNFGVAPAILVYNHHLNQLNWLGWLIASLYVIATALRLARFNVRIKTNIRNPDFLGLPSTGAAVALISADASLSAAVSAAPYDAAAVAIIAVALSSLMVSNLPVPTLRNLISRLRGIASRR